MTITHAISSLISKWPGPNISIACSISIHSIPSKKSNNCEMVFNKNFPQRINELTHGEE